MAQKLMRKKIKVDPIPIPPHFSQNQARMASKHQGPPPTDEFHLRSIAATLASVPDASLPPEIPPIISTLYSTPSVLEAVFLRIGNSAKHEPDLSILLHKYKTRISSLLQSRSPQGRWAAVALVKASIESSPEALGTWAKTWVPLVTALLGVCLL